MVLKLRFCGTKVPVLRYQSACSAVPKCLFFAFCLQAKELALTNKRSCGYKQKTLRLKAETFENKIIRRAKERAKKVLRIEINFMIHFVVSGKSRNFERKNI
ncbi:MAG: hypothetical protein IJ604_03635 [Prevotella sp.]|nr:hypothetical protein [Prevotella sp.]